MVLVDDDDSLVSTLLHGVARRDPLILTNVGKIIWGIRNDLAMAEEESMIESHGVAVEPEQIEDYEILPGGVQLHAMRGESHWVPWNALKLDGEDPDAVDLLIQQEGWYGPHTVDDDAREISFEGLAVLNLDGCSHVLGPTRAATPATRRHSGSGRPCGYCGYSPSKTL